MYDQKYKNDKTRPRNEFALESISWNVIIIWECELKREELATTIEKVIAQLESNGMRWQKWKAGRRTNRQEYLSLMREHRERLESVKKELFIKYGTTFTAPTTDMGE